MRPIRVTSLQPQTNLDNKLLAVAAIHRAVGRNYHLTRAFNDLIDRHVVTAIGDHDPQSYRTAYPDTRLQTP